MPPDPDGFVHLSRPSQVAGTIARHFPGVAAVVLLEVDEAALPAAALREEGGFPHLYATLPASAVVRVSAAPGPGAGR